YKDFVNSFKHLYGESSYEEVKELIYKKDVEALDKQLRKYSGLAFGTEAQMKKLGLDYDVKTNVFYGKLGRNPHQYVSSIQSARVSVIDKKMQNKSFFKTFYGKGESKPMGSQNSLNFLGRLTAMSMHGDHDGDQYQLLGFHAKDFKYAGDDAEKVAKKMTKLSKLQYHMRNIDSNMNVEDELMNGKHFNNGHVRKMLDLAKELNFKDTDASSTDLEVFEKISKQYFVQKNEMIRANLEMLDENEKHGMLPDFKNLFTTTINDKGEVVKINVDKYEASKMIAKMDPNTRMKLFLNNGNIDDTDVEKVFSEVDKETLATIKKFRQYQTIVADGKATQQDIEAMS
ncbi:MAG: hypothetical protein ACRCZ2_00635, partial [Fusobacteriaceae bacterium]